MKKFIIAGLQRTGTTMLVRFLSEHENINVQGELFINKYPNKTPFSYQNYIMQSKTHRVRDILYKSSSTKRYLDEIFSAPSQLFRSEEMHNKCSAIGFKLMRNQARKNPSILNYIKKRNISAVHIVRKNSLNVLVSREVNKIFEIAHTKEKIVTPQIEINPNRLLGSIQSLESVNAKWESELSSIPYLKIFYEDFVKDKEQGLNRITDFIGVPSCPGLQFQTTKLNPTDLKKSIKNYEEVAKVLKGTKYETYL